MAHIVVPEAEAILDKEFKVLDHGFVRLVDYLGGDKRIVQAARVSYGEGTKTVRKDRGLINYLMRNRHTSPFEQVILTFHVKLPIFVARQWIRHRTARLNEISGRYSVMKDEFYLPEPDAVRKQSKRNKQGRDAELPRDVQERFIRLIQQEQASLYESYSAAIEEDVARELARINLPLSLYTEWYWQIDLHNLFHFLNLRLDEHAQYEIRQYGEVMAMMVRKVAPMAYEAFENHVLYAKNISKPDLDKLGAYLRKQAKEDPRAEELADELGL
jgi:thymidylate synthase (FAD)